MVHFYNGNDSKKYVTLEKSGAEQNEEAEKETPMASEKGKNVNGCKRQLTRANIALMILSICVIILIILSSVTQKDIRSLKLLIGNERKRISDFEKGVNDTLLCNFTYGYGIGGSSVEISPTTKQISCVQSCSLLKKVDPSINAVTIQTGSSLPGCWCKRAITSITSRYKTCFLKANSTDVIRGLNETYSCKFGPGDGTGGSEFKIGMQKGKQCIDACLHMKRLNPAINGVTMYQNASRGGCWCEHAMGSIRHSRVYRTCYLKANITQINTALKNTSTCSFTPGDGIGGKEVSVGTRIGNASCIDACLHMKLIDPTVNGVTMFNNGNNRGCWCEKNMRGIGGKYKTCFLKPFKASP